MFRRLCLPLVPADGILAANPEERQALVNHWAAHARTIRVYVTWRAESQVQEQVEKLNGRRHPTKQNRQNRPVRRKSAQRLSMIPKSGYRFSEKIMLQHKRCVRASFGAACFSNLQGSPELPAAGRASP
jgi:hypothetical protein